MEIFSPYSHLGHIISSSDGDRLDIMSRNVTLMVKLIIHVCSVFWEAPIRGQITFVLFVVRASMDANCGAWHVIRC